MLVACKWIIKSKAISNLIFACLAATEFSPFSWKLILKKLFYLKLNVFMLFPGRRGLWKQSESDDHQGWRCRFASWGFGNDAMMIKLTKFSKLKSQLGRSADGAQWRKTYIIVKAKFKVQFQFFHCLFALWYIVMNIGVITIQERLLFWDSPTSASGVPRESSRGGCWRSSTSIIRTKSATTNCNLQPWRSIP